MSRASSTTRAVKPGFSLIEILVTLVILLIGVLAILRLFPPGFLTIQRTGELTGAQALAKLQLDSQVELPTQAEQILGVKPDASGNPVVIDLSVDQPRPDDLRDYTAQEIADKAGVPVGALTDKEGFYSNINQIRAIVGEKFRIPALTPNSVSGAFGSVYFLRQGPVFNRAGVAAPSSNLQVHGTPLERTIQTDEISDARPTGAATLLNDSQYAIDYAKRQIAFFPRAAAGRTRPFRNYSIKINYYVEEGGEVVLETTLPPLILRVDDVLVAAGDPLPVPRWQQLPPINLPAGETFLGLVSQSEEVSREFLLLATQPVATSGTAPGWSDDPYEYAWYSKQYGDANPGVLLFNPVGRNYAVQTSSGPQPLLARADYITYDNHIVRDDRQVAYDGNQNDADKRFNLRLSLPSVLATGDRLDDQTVYQGVIREDNNSPSILIYNLQTGESLVETAVRCAGNGTEPYTLDARSGTVRINATLVNDARSNLKNATLRIYYRTAKDHGLQLQKAHARYVASNSVTAIPNNGFWAGNISVPASKTTRLYFPKSEIGKSVIIGEYYVRTNLTSNDYNGFGSAQKNGIIPLQEGGALAFFRRLGQETYQISEDTEQGLNLPYIDVQSQHPEAVAEGWRLSRAITGAAAANVQGASLKSRVLWRDSAQRTTDSATGAVRYVPRWRRYDSDTVLLPKPTQ